MKVAIIKHAFKYAAYVKFAVDQTSASNGG